MPEPLSEQRLADIYRTTIDAFYAYVSRRCGGDRLLAEDVTQDAWLRAVRDWQRNGVPRIPLAWLRTVARNLILNHLRRQAPVSLDAVPHTALLAAVEHEAVSDPEEVAAVVTAALARIPDDEATLLEAFHFDQHRTAELARAYGISERAVEGRLRRARARLRRELELSLRSLGEIT